MRWLWPCNHNSSTLDNSSLSVDSAEINITMGSPGQYFMTDWTCDAAAKCRRPLTAGFCIPCTFIISYTRQCIDSQMCPPTTCQIKVQKIF